jgi:hypothetical protein
MYESKGTNRNDDRKLKRVLGYLLKMRKRVLILKLLESFKVVAYMYASYAIHDDGKSHWGIVVLAGGVQVFCASKKQRCASKSPTDAELIPLSDNIGFVELFHEFVEFIKNSKIVAPLIYQGNTSVISMIETGGGIIQNETHAV